MATTPNLGLHQWQSGDSFLRTDFNTDFSKIDTAVGAAPAKAHAAGVYQGSGSITKPTTIELGFRPSAVLTFQLDQFYSQRPLLSVPGNEPNYYGQKAIEFLPTGFRVNLLFEKTNDVITGPYTNSDCLFAYIAFR